ncbi:MAG TPA: hypothetical protein VHU40_22035 [Polyangia bacterium]|nr:hypothetical protein [Polyangia bacterium]
MATAEQESAEPRARKAQPPGSDASGGRLFATTTEGFVLVDRLALRGRTAPSRERQVLSPSLALWILDESWRRDDGESLRRFADERGIGNTAMQQVADLQLRQSLAAYIERGELVVLRETFAPKAFPAPPPESEAPALAPLPAAAAAPAVEPPPVIVDETAQLRALWAAARDGVPFCEECAKALQRAA